MSRPNAVCLDSASFTIIGRHFAADLLEGQGVEAIMDCVEGHRTKLTGMTEGT